MQVINSVSKAVFKVFNPGLEFGRRVVFDPRAFPARGGRISIGADSVVRAGVMLLPSGGHIEIGQRVSLNLDTAVDDDVLAGDPCGQWVCARNRRSPDG